MGHGQLVLHQQQAVQKCPGLEIQGMVHVVLGADQLARSAFEDLLEDVPGPDVLDLLPNGLEHGLIEVVPVDWTGQRLS